MVHSLDAADFQCVAVCGAGSMGAGIAQVAAQAGHDVVVFDKDEAAFERGKATVAKGAAALLKRGKIDEQEARAISDRVRWTSDVEGLAGASLVIEAIIENAEIKTSLFARLEEVLRPDAIIATNTSSLSVTVLASELKHPERFLGLHFFNPAPVMKLVEVVRGIDTDNDYLTTASALMTQWGKIAVEVSDVPGFIVNRVARPFYGEGWRAFEEGAADPATLDFLYRDLAGFRMGPFELGDLIGHDVNSAAAKSVYDAYHGRTRFSPSLRQAQMAAAGRLGRKSGQGVYAYGEDAEKAEVAYAPLPNEKTVSIVLGSKAVQMQQLCDAAGVTYKLNDEAGYEFDCFIDDACVGFTQGETAKSLALVAPNSCAVLDWMRDPASASAIAFAASDDYAREAVLKFAVALGKEAVELRDRPGLVVFRTLLQLANCAADAVRDHVAEARSIDQAMKYGVNYPFGPMELVAETGASDVVDALQTITGQTGDEMYSPSETLQSLALDQLMEEND